MMREKKNRGSGVDTSMTASSFDEDRWRDVRPRLYFIVPASELRCHRPHFSWGQLHVRAVPIHIILYVVVETL